METNKEIKKTETLTQKALRLLSPIDDNNWNTNWYCNSDGGYCAIGHLTRLTQEDVTNENINSKANAKEILDFRDSTRKYLKTNHNLYPCDIVLVNDTKSINGYNEETPKARVIHLLNDMVKAGY